MKLVAWISILTATAIVAVICTWMIAAPNRTVDGAPSQPTAQTSPFSTATTSGVKQD
jgi:hypothetical protein